LFPVSINASQLPRPRGHDSLPRPQSPTPPTGLAGFTAAPRSAQRPPAPLRPPRRPASLPFSTGVSCFGFHGKQVDLTSPPFSKKNHRGVPFRVPVRNKMLPTSAVLFRQICRWKRAETKTKKNSGAGGGAKKRNTGVGWPPIPTPATPHHPTHPPRLAHSPPPPPPPGGVGGARPLSNNPSPPCRRFGSRPFTSAMVGGRDAGLRLAVRFRFPGQTERLDSSRQRFSSNWSDVGGAGLFQSFRFHPSRRRASCASRHGLPQTAARPFAGCKVHAQQVLRLMENRS